MLDPLTDVQAIIAAGFGLGFTVMFFAWGITGVLRYFFRLLGL
jgi:hypothetical protein